VQIGVLGGDAAADELEAAATIGYAMNKSVIRLSQAQASGELPPLLAETLPHLKLDRSAAVVCKGTSCQAPVSAPEELLELLVL
jgi:uncharacterized protein YyaL (SSP411 family)